MLQSICAINFLSNDAVGTAPVHTGERGGPIFVNVFKPLGRSAALPRPTTLSEIWTLEAIPGCLSRRINA
jgi:hypothetical protein